MKSRERIVRSIMSLYRDFDFDDIDAYANAKKEKDIYAIALMDAIDAVNDCFEEDVEEVCENCIFSGGSWRCQECDVDTNMVSD